MINNMTLQRSTITIGVTILALELTGCKFSTTSPSSPISSHPTSLSAPFVFPAKDKVGWEGTGIVGGYGRISKALNQLVGPNAVDCGWANPYDSKRFIVDACGITAFRKRRAFRLMYNVSVHQGIRNYGLGGNSKGQLFFLSNADGTDNQVFEEKLHRCQHPLIVRVNGHFRFSCKEKRNLLP